MSDHTPDDKIVELSARITQLEKTIDETTQTSHTIKQMISLLFILVGIGFLFSLGTFLFGCIIIIISLMIAYKTYPANISQKKSPLVRRNTAQNYYSPPQSRTLQAESNTSSESIAPSLWDYEETSHMQEKTPLSSSVMTEATHAPLRENVHEEVVEEISPQKVVTSPDEDTHAFSLEAQIGMKWSSILGIMALVLGVGFFIKYAIDAGWISYTVRIFLSVLLGLALAGGGYYMGYKEKYKNLARTLMAGGFAITYFSTYASYYFEAYRLETGMTEEAVLMLLTAIVAFGTFTALKMNSKILVSEGFLLGYLTSLLSVHFSLLTLTYCFLLSLGLLGITYYKKWVRLGIAGTLVTYGTYFVSNNASHYSVFQGGSFLTLFFLTFIAQILLADSSEEVEAPVYSSGMVLNGLLYAGLMIQLLKEYSPEIQGMFLLGIALVYALQTVFVRTKNNSILFEASFYLSIFFLTTALICLVHGASLLSTILLESILGILMFQKTKEKPWLYSSLILSAIALVGVFLYGLLSLMASEITMAVNSMFALGIVTGFLFYKLLGKESLPNKTEYFFGIFGIILSYLFLCVHLKTNIILFNGSIAFLTFFFVLITQGKDSLFRTNGFVIFILLAIKIYTDFMSSGSVSLLFNKDIGQVVLLLSYLIPATLHFMYLYLKKTELPAHEVKLLYVQGVAVNFSALIWLSYVGAYHVWYILAFLAVTLFYTLPGFIAKRDEYLIQITLWSLLALALRYLSADFTTLGGLWKIGEVSLALIPGSLSFILPVSVYAYYLSKENTTFHNRTAYLLSWSAFLTYFITIFQLFSTLQEVYIMTMILTSLLLIYASKTSWKSFYEESILAYGTGAFATLYFIHFVSSWEALSYIAVLWTVVGSYGMALLWNSTEHPGKIMLNQVYASVGSILFTLFLAQITQAFMISASWAIFALVLIICGLRFQNKLLRWHGIILFALTIGKIILIDLNNVDPIYRILSFIALGVLLLVTSFVYTKNKEKFKNYL